MLDLRFIKENTQAVKENVKKRNVDADVDKVIKLYDQRNDLIQKIDSLRKERNENAAKMKGKVDPDLRTKLISQGKELKQKISSMEEELKSAEAPLMEEVRKIPNMSHPEAPIGKEEKDNTQLKRWGDVPEFSFKAKDHLDLGTSLGIIDFDTAAKVSGQKFYYLMGKGALLDLALSRYAMDVLAEKGFTLSLTPDIAKEEIVDGIGYNPRGAETNIYSLAGEKACLVGTAEITLGGYYANQIIDADNLPIKMGGYSHCFRREAGAAGQYSKGLYRVHQFTKVEMFIFCRPDESEKYHDQLLAIEEKIFQDLEIPYRVVDTCTGDLGGPAYRKYDIEAWMPGRGDTGDWGEVTSTSNCTDYQARRLGIRFKGDGKTQYVHMLNGTAVAVSRALIAILENHQREDGTVKIPEKLIPYTGFKEIC